MGSSLGNEATRSPIDNIATSLESRSYTITGGVVVEKLKSFQNYRFIAKVTEHCFSITMSSLLD